MAIDWTVEADAASALRDTFGIESDLSDAALHAHALAAVAEIAARVPFGGTHVRYAASGHRYIRLHPPAASITSITEDGDELVEDTDYRLLLGGRMLDRRVSDTTPYRFSGDVVVTYTAPDPDERYDRVVADLVQIALQYSGLDQVTDGDYEELGVGTRFSKGGGYQGERERLIAELVPSSAGVFA